MPQLVSTTMPGGRDAIVSQFLPLVRRVAMPHLGRVPAGVDLGDLVAWGTMGLLAAVDRFDPARETLFATYARFRIRGEILDQLRQLDWVPRRVREKAGAVERVAERLAGRFGRPAHEDEIARGLGLELGSYRLLREEIAGAAPASLESFGPEGEECGADAGPLGELLRREQLHFVANAVQRLSPREQLVLSLYYRDELTMKEAGAVLGVTESRICQLHRRALRRLRAILCGPDGDQAVERSA